MKDLRGSIEDIWYGSRRGGVLSHFLGAAAAAYGVGLGARRALYDHGVNKTGHPGVPCVSVGNIVVGGTGKTPMTAWLVTEMLRRGRQPAVVSRGYGGTTIRPVRVPAGGGSGACRTFGDEPVMLATAFPQVPVIVARDRFKAAAYAVSECRADIIVADDAFQHWRLERDLDIVLVDGRRWFGNGRLFPRGPLREAPAALGRAGVIVLTRPKSGGSSAGMAELRALAPGAVVASADILPVRWRRWDADREAAAPRGPFFAFCGVADHRPFREAVEGEGRLAGWRSFADHYPYGAAEVRALREQAEKSGAAAAVTTAKDAVRLPGWESRLPLYVLDVSFRFTAGAEKVGELLNSLSARGLP